MRIDSVQVVNFCQYENKTVSFSPGLNCIVGPNGVGKSNLMMAISGGITGIFPKIDGTRAQNIRYGSSGASYVRVNFEHQGVDYIVQRDFKPSAHRLFVGLKEYVKEVVVKEMMTDILGISMEVISDFAFVQQGKMDEFLVSGDVDRLSGLQELFGLTVAEKLWRALGNALEPVVPPSINVPIVEQRLAANKASYAEVLKTLAGSTTSMASEANKARNAAMLAVQRQGAAKLAAVARVEILKAQDNLRKHLEVKEERKKSYDQAVLDTHEFEKFRAMVDAYRRDWLEYNRFITMQKILSDRLNLDQREVAKYTAVAKPSWYLEVDPSADFQISSVQSETSKWESVLAAIANGNNACPTCFTPSNQMHFDPVQKRKWLDETKPIVEEFKEIYRKSRDWDNANAAREVALAAVTARMHATVVELEALCVVAKPDKSPEELDRIYNKCLAAISTRKTCERLYQASVNDQTELEMEVERRKLALISCSPDSDPPSDGEVERLRKYADELSLKSTDYERAAINKQLLEKLIEDDQKLLDSVAPEEAKAKLARGYNDHIESVRSVLHRNALPASAAKRGLQIVEGYVNELLQAFDAGFSVAVDDQLRFVATLKTGAVQPAYRLSGGQRILLSLAFRVAVSKIFASDLRLLCLDEPTAWLDDRSMKCLETAFAYLRQLSAATGLQVIMITHERSLDHLFDKVIDLT